MDCAGDASREAPEVMLLAFPSRLRERRVRDADSAPRSEWPITRSSGDLSCKQERKKN
jgi:hypothetical protein